MEHNRGYCFFCTLISFFFFFSAAKANTFLNDNRVLAESDQFPGRAIGKLILPDRKSYCTATLISPDLILSAAHCVFNENTFKKEPGIFQFVAGYNLKENQGFSDIDENQIWYGTNNPWANQGKDWAILRLKKALGNDLGWLDVQPVVDFKLMNIFVQLIGYSSDYSVGEQASMGACKIRSVGHAFGDPMPQVYFDDCDMMPGASGAPIFYKDGNSTNIVAINISCQVAEAGSPCYSNVEYSSDKANVAVPVIAFLPQLQEILAQTR